MTSVPTLTLNSGYKIPQLGLGTFLSKVGEAGDSVKNALDVGYRHIDCAYVYGNQDEIGQVFHDYFANGKVKREDVFITTKIWNTFHSQKKATELIDIMLKQLQISYLDLLLIHWPMGFAEGGDTFPKDESGGIKYSDVDYLDTWKAMEDAVKAGKVRSIGLSNFNIKQIERVLSNSTIKPAALQIEIHPYLAQNTLVKFCQDRGIIVTAYSPLGNNAHIARKEGQPNLLEDKVVVDIAGKHKKTPAQVCIRWAIQRGYTVIPKSVHRKRLEENFNVFDFELTSDEIKSITGLDRDLRITALERDIKHPHYPFHDKA